MVFLLCFITHSYVHTDNLRVNPFTQQISVLASGAAQVEPAGTKLANKAKGQVRFGIDPRSLSISYEKAGAKDPLSYVLLQENQLDFGALAQSKIALGVANKEIIIACKPQIE